MSFLINGIELKKALKDIRCAEKNGFMFCKSVFEPSGIDGIFVNLRYSDIDESAHPTDTRFHWGRFQDVSKRNKFKNGKLIPIKKLNKEE